MSPVMIGCMPKKYNDIYDQLLSNSIQNGECLESLHKPGASGRVYVTHKRKMIAASRACWIYHHGMIPTNMFICHHCDNPKCFRIDHLFLGTPADNVKDMVNKRRDNTFGNRKYPLDTLEKASKLREEGYSCAAIGRTLNVKCCAISSLMRRHKVIKGVSKPRPRRIPIEIVNNIDELVKAGFINKHIYEKLGISESTFYLRKKMKGTK